MKASRILGIVFLLATVAGCFSEKPRVVLYCAQDKEFADDILEQFHKKTGLEATPKFDTEADKSVSLYVELVKEKERPRCDVFWNNEPLSTIRLQRQGLLEPYDSPSAAPYPASAKDKNHCWTAFANRARVLLVNTDLVKEADRPKSLLDLTAEKWKGRVAMSRPQFGTSATQAACLFEVLGSEKAKKYYQDLRANGVQISPGNKQAAEWAGAGRTPAGQEIAVAVTDTDDSLEEIKAGSHVAIIFPGSRRGSRQPHGDAIFTKYGRHYPRLSRSARRTEAGGLLAQRRHGKTACRSRQPSNPTEPGSEGDSAGRHREWANGASDGGGLREGGGHVGRSAELSARRVCAVVSSGRSR